jgi:hypothetical protein
MTQYEFNKIKKVLTRMSAERIETLKGFQVKCAEDKEKWIKYESQIRELDDLTSKFCSLTVKKYNEMAKSIN